VSQESKLLNQPPGLTCPDYWASQFSTRGATFETRLFEHYSRWYAPQMVGFKPLALCESFPNLLHSQLEIQSILRPSWVSYWALAFQLEIQQVVCYWSWPQSKNYLSKVSFSWLLKTCLIAYCLFEDLDNVLCQGSHMIWLDLILILDSISSEKSPLSQKIIEAAIK
jgi:hypothetical protein